jgi:hypothetical protein
MPFAPVRPPWNGKTNRMSIAALVLSFFGSGGLIGIGLGIGGLLNSRRNGDKRGKVIAIIALSISGVWVLIFAIAVGVAIVSDMKDPERDDNGVIRGERTIALDSLRVGDCIKDLAGQDGSRIDVVNCSLPHSSEVVATVTLGRDATDEAAGNTCGKLFTEYTGNQPPADAGYSVAAVQLITAGSADFNTLCVAHQDSGTTTGSVKD